MSLLAGKTCLITGGAGSIGRATAHRFLAEGARLILSDLNLVDLEKARAELPQGDIVLIAADVSQAGAVADLAAQVTERFGGLDVVLSNAGNFGTVAPIADYPDAVFDQVHAVHVRGAYLVAKHLTPLMVSGGSLIITSSVAGVRGDPGVYAYITAKHAQVGLMRCLAKELAPRGIRVNTIHPGPVNNDFQLAVEQGLGDEIGRDGTAFFNEMIPMGRHATPDEIARSILYLASDLSGFVTGTTHMVDGGMSV
ncbi:SDR family oxidoreductase [Devosia sp. J2-20]|uniref:SDR family NAD(P)-dependent oxidoreductase n=1 Tax=Devosia sp. J2-20 TaxID=3026161 RepID=UPI00249C0ADE|nr:SDR family oxidoreductase [Devosia sp. J2-20]WDQ98151.1 SDR family oxidoreductase [Devosia sp. J2-20]